MSERRSTVPNQRRIRSVSNALAALRVLAANPDGVGVTQLAIGLGIGKSSAHLLLATLAAEDFVSRAPDGRYVLGIGAFEVGTAAGGVAAPGGPLTQELRSLAEASSEAVSLAALSGSDAILVQRIESASMLRAEIQVGTRMPLHASASGKLLLSEMPRERALRLFPEATLPVLTSHSIRTRSELCMALDEIRERGYAWNSEEYVEGISGVAVGVRDSTGEVVLALSIAGPTHRFQPSEWVERTLDCAARMTGILCTLRPGTVWPTRLDVASGSEWAQG